MRNTEEVQRLVKQVMEEENNLVELLDKKGQFHKGKGSCDEHDETHGEAEKMDRGL